MTDESFLEIEEKMLDVNIEQCLNMYEKAISLYEINMQKASHGMLVMEFTFDDFKKKIIEIGKKAIETIKKFIHSASIKIDTKIQQMKINMKLKEVKDLLARKKAKAMKSKVTFVDVRKYKKYYKKYIDTYVSELKSGLNRDFKSINEFNKWKDKMTSNLTEFSYTLSDKERWTLSNAINDTVKLTEEEIKNKNQSIQTLKKHSTSVINELSNMAIKDTDMQYNKDKGVQLLTGKKSLIGFVIGKITQCIKTLVSFVTKHTFLCITALIVILVAL